MVGGGKATHAGLAEPPLHAKRPLLEHEQVHLKHDVDRANATDVALTCELAPRPGRAAVHLKAVRAQQHAREERDQRDAERALEVGELGGEGAEERRGQWG